MAVLDLRFCARALSSCSNRGPLFIAVRGPLTITASLVAEHRLQTRRLSICGSRAHPLRGMWDLPRPGLEPVSPALAGRLPTTAPPGKPQVFCFCCCCFSVSFPLCDLFSVVSITMSSGSQMFSSAKFYLLVISSSIFSISDIAVCIYSMSLPNMLNSNVSFLNL